MAAFDPYAQLSEDVGYRLIQNTFVTLFWRPELLTVTVEQLRGSGYHVIEVDASRWTTEADLHRDMAAAFDFPAYYGRNLDALNDCLRDVAIHNYGTEPQAVGTVLALTGYDAFARRCPRAAQVLLDIFAGTARSALLFGHRMLCLAQSTDPDIRFDPVGATPVAWNDAEWMDARRRPG